MRSTVSVAVKPVLLGGEKLALKIALLLFLRYMVSSCVFSKELPFFRKLLIFARFKELPSSKNDKLTVMALEHYANEYGDSTYILIPCDEEHAELVWRNKEILENRFIIRTPEEILYQREIFPLSSTGGKDV